MSAIDLLMVGAHPPALIGLRDQLGQGMSGSVFGLHVSAKVCGVGMGVVGAMTTKRIIALQPRAAILVGTAGLYPDVGGFQPLDVVIGDEIKLLDHAAIAQRSTFPGPMQVRVGCSQVLSAGLMGDGRSRVHRVHVASPLADTTDPAMGRLVPDQLGCRVESLEAFAFAQACQMMQIPFGVVLGVSHVIGEHAMSDWHRYHRDASRAASTAVLNWLRVGAPGVPHRR